MYRAVGDLGPDPRNARTHSKRQIGQIAASIAEFGFSNPILIDADQSVIAGHGRLLAARSLGMSEVPTIELTGLSEAQLRALRIADNRIALESKWDFDILKAELSGLAAIDFDLTITGFSTGELDRLTGRSAATGDTPPLAPIEPRTQRGDIWTLGDHRIGCGDGRDAAFLERLIGAPDGVAAAFLDPLDADAAGAAMARTGSRDKASPASTIFLKEAFGAAAQVSRAGAIHFVRADWRALDEVSEAGRYIYGEPLDLCVWTGKQGSAGPLYRSGHELLFVYRVGEAPPPCAGEAGKRSRARSNVWDDRADTEGYGAAGGSPHAAAMPAGLIVEAIRDVTRPGETVLVPFLGTGSALIAADQTRRCLRGADRDPARVEAAMARWAAATGGTPVLESPEAAA